MKQIVCFHVYNDYSGSPKVLSMVLKELLQKGYSVDLVTSRGCQGALDSLDGMAGFKKSTFYYKFNDRNLVLTSLNYLWTQVYMFCYAFRYLFKPDVVFYINTIMPWGAALAGRIIGKRVIYHYHENAFAKGPHYRLYAWIMSGLAHVIICVSAYQASFLKRKNGVTVIPNALSNEFVENLHQDANRAFINKNILMLSSLKEYKGTKEFIKVACDMPQYHFTLVINDSQVNIDRYLADNKICIPHNIDVYPRQSDVALFYNQASLVVNLTNKEQAIETFGMTPLEAMTCGLPVIVPTVGGIAELVVDGRNGFRIDVQDLSKIEDAIDTILSDRNLYMAMSENALCKSKEYDINGMISKIQTIIDLNSIFLELLQVSLGKRSSLSHIPSLYEWVGLYKLSQKQSVLGVCFTGLQYIMGSTGPILSRLSTIAMPKPVYDKWIVAAALIQQKSESHKRALKELAEFLCGKGYRAIFMKGLTCAERYPEPLLRQCGDIDFVVKEEEFSDVMNALEEIAEVDHDLAHEHHGMAQMGGVPLEPHYKIHNFQNPRNDRMMRALQRSLLNSKERCIVHIGDVEVEKFPLEFEGMFLVSHMVNHTYAEGLGIRQVMDYAMWIMDLPNHNDFDMGLFNEYLRKMHMTKAARIFTCICDRCLSVDHAIMGYEYTAREIRFADKLLDDILAVGNFARGVENHPDAGWQAYWWTTKRAWRLGYLCPSEARWWPISKMVRFFDKKLNTDKYRH